MAPHDGCAYPSSKVESPCLLAASDLALVGSFLTCLLDFGIDNWCMHECFERADHILRRHPGVQ